MSDDDITPEDRRHGPVHAVLKNPGGRVVELRLKKAPMTLVYRYGKVERTYEVSSIDSKGRFVYSPVGEARKA